jgi:alpha-N-arabinofuranosidase
VLTPTYHVFDLYQEHQDATLLPIELEAGEYRYGDEAIPALNASASRSTEGAVHLTIANLDPHQERIVRCNLEGMQAARVTGRVLTAEAMDAHNTFEAPNQVRPTTFTSYRMIGNGVYELRLPSKSVVALTFLPR